MISLLIHTTGQILTLSEPHHQPKRGKEMSQLEIMNGGYIGIDASSGKITYVSSSAPDSSIIDEALVEIDAKDKVIMPAFIDCHNHLIWGGTRVDEFFERCQGKSYQEIARDGGGILYTRDKTVNASDEELLGKTRRTLDALTRAGVATMEAKTGYALTLEGELRLLYLISQLASESNGRIVPTLLLHKIPPERANDRESFISEFISVLPVVRAQGLTSFLDVYIDENALSMDEARAVLTEAKKLGFYLRIHAEQFSADGSSMLGVELGAHTLDHLDFISVGAIEAIAKTNAVCVLLPGSNFFTRESHFAPTRDLIDSGAIVALATDLNPGSSHIFSPAFIMSLACLNMKMRAEECLSAFTKNSAFALNLGYNKGTITPGNDADILILDTDDYRDLIYAIGTDLINSLFISGKLINREKVIEKG